MFKKLLSRIKEVIGLTGGDVYSKFGLTNPSNSEMEAAVQSWREIYKGNMPWLDRSNQSLRLASTIANKIASTVTVESKIEVGGSARGDFLNEMLKPVLENLTIDTEYACAEGGLAFKPYAVNGKIEVDVVHSDCFKPVSYNSRGEITSAIFVETLTKSDTVFIRLEYHRFSENNVYQISNRAYRALGKDSGGYATPISITEVPEWAEIEPEVSIEGLQCQLYSYFKIPIGNKIDPKSPVGVSVYADAIDLIKEADKQWQRLMWEYEGSELAIEASESMFAVNLRGEPVLPIGKERLYRMNKIDPRKSEDMIYKVFDPELRDEAYLRGLNKIKNEIEDKIGLARGTLSDPNEVEKTATEIVSSKQSTYVFVTLIQRALQKALDGLLDAMNALASLYNLAPEGEYSATYVWDDSIVVNADAEREKDREDVRDNLMQRWEYRVKWYGETKEEAMAILASSEEQSDDEIMGFDRKTPAAMNSPTEPTESVVR